MAELGSDTDFRRSTWDNGFIEKGIRAKRGREFLQVVFLDSRFTSDIDNQNKNVYALIPTKESLYSEVHFIRSQDALKLGTFLILL
jgi:hypothetical protein